jgi:hypothetical protein
VPFYLILTAISMSILKGNEVDGWYVEPYTAEEIDNIRYVDFDETIAHNTGQPDFKPTTPLSGVWAKLRTWTDEGKDIRIFTARASTDERLLEAWMAYYSIPFGGKIVFGKPLGLLYDDRARQVSDNWKDL